jgi:hypothetical protein
MKNIDDGADFFSPFVDKNNHVMMDEIKIAGMKAMMMWAGSRRWTSTLWAPTTAFNMPVCSTSSTR